MQTLELLSDTLHPDIANIVNDYFASHSTNAYELAKNGEWELVADFTDQLYMDSALAGAKAGGYDELAQLMISKGAHDWNEISRGACLGGHIELARLMLENTDVYWDNAVFAAHN
jgi:hypothetical protein